MRILIDIGHPGHVHLFKHLAHKIVAEGHEVLFTVRDKECELELLEAEHFPYKNFGKHYKSLWGKLWGLIKFDLEMWWTAVQFKPDLLLSHGSIYAAHIAFLLGKKHLSLEDSGNMEQILLYRPFTETILTPAVLLEQLGPKQVRYNGYHEIAYLHPNYFRPNINAYEWLGLELGTPYAIVRFVSWNATHDLGHKGLTHADKIKLVEKLAETKKVFISAEADLPPELEQHKIRLAPEQLHDALYYADLVVSEGTTIASEAGVLGTPAIYINSIARSYVQDQERYGLVYNTCDSAKVFALVDQILAQDREVFRERRERLLDEKIDVTAFLHQFIIDHYVKHLPAEVSGRAPLLPG